MQSRSRVLAYRGMLSDHYLGHDAKAEALPLWPTKLQELAAGAGELLIAERDQVAVGFICMIKPLSRAASTSTTCTPCPGTQARSLAQRCWTRREGRHTIVVPSYRHRMSPG